MANTLRVQLPSLLYPGALSVTTALIGGTILDGVLNLDLLPASVLDDLLANGLLSGTSTADIVNLNTNILGINLNLAGGNDSFVGGAGNDVIRGGAGDDVISGEGGNDTLFGEDGNDTLFGGAGNDSLQGGAGDDHLYGGPGADSLSGGAGFDYAHYDSASAGVTAALFAPSLNTGDAAGDTYDGIEGLVGSTFDDFLFGDGGNNTIIGLSGNDYLAGREGNDILFGGDGNDVLIGGTGADVLDGGAGFDFASYADATSTVVVRLDFAAGLLGDANGDSFTFADGHLTVEGVIGSNYNDTIIGDDSGNGIYGGGGNDVILGLGGSDGIFGDFGNDTLFGGRGADYLVGGNGAPVPAGQTDNDVFAFVSADTEAGVYDTIIDFHDGEDAILLQGFGYTDAAPPVLIDITYGPNTPAAVISYGGGTAGVTIVGITTAQLQGAPAPGGDWYLY